MTNNFNAYVSYIIAPPRRGVEQRAYSDKVIAEHEAKVREFLGSRPMSNLTAGFVEIGENKRNRNYWPELSKAITFCKQNKCYLIITEIGSNLNNYSFTKLVNDYLASTNSNPYISSFTPNVFCIDQNYISRENFRVLTEHAEQQKKMHGDLIKQGLSKTSAKSGNPNAADVISKVNKPKIENAIIFALILQPVINEYKKENLSQRKIVARLNEEGFSAPEGGKWVLSQLQKVLERIKHNESAILLKDKFKLYSTKNLTTTEIAATLNNEEVTPPKGLTWNENIVSAVQQRISTLSDIQDFNNFIEIMLPILKGNRIEELDETMLSLELEKLNIGKTKAQTDTTTIS